MVEFEQKNGSAAAMTDLVAGYVNERLDDYLRVLVDEKNKSTVDCNLQTTEIERKN